MNQRLHIARDGVELGVLTEKEVHELLHAGFLRRGDAWRGKGMEEWQPLSEIGTASASRTPAALLAKAKQKVSVATGALGQEATKLTQKLKSLTRAGNDKVSDATQRILEDFTPQIQKLVSNELVANSLTKAQAVVRDDEMTRKIFGAVYDCLPKPVYRFVSEAAFIEFCMARRRKLLGLSDDASDTLPF